MAYFSGNITLQRRYHNTEASTIFPYANLEPLVIIWSTVVKSCCQYVHPGLDTLRKLISIRHCLIRTPSAWGYSHKQHNPASECRKWAVICVFLIRKIEHWVCLFMPGAVQVMLKCLYLDKNCCSVSLRFISGFIATTEKQQHFMVAMEVIFSLFSKWACMYLYIHTVYQLMVILKLFGLTAKCTIAGIMNTLSSSVLLPFKVCNV